MTNFSNLKAGSVLSETQFYTVDKVVGNEVHLKTESGEKIALPKQYVETFLQSGDQFTETEKINRTQLAEILMSHPRVAMTVNFNKQIKDTDIHKEIMEAYNNSTPAAFDKASRAAAKRAMNGEERTMTGRHYGHRDEFGRIQFIDMALDPKADAAQGKRLVDPRTLNWIIVGGKKYIVK